MYRITVNKSLNLIAKRKRRPANDVEVKDYHSVEFNHPGIQFENQEKAKILFQVINTLVDTQRTAFILSFVEELSRQEVADIMETSLKSVESLLQRAKTNLRKKLIKVYPEGNKK